MNLMLLRLFQRQVLFQCECAMFAASELNIALQHRDSKRVFYSLQNLLNAAANISKALWGQQGKLSSKRQILRTSIGVNEDSPLKPVTMRNNFEHLDERLDKWWKESKQHNHFDFSVLPKSSVQGIASIDWFRVFDPTTTDLYFWSQEFNIQEIVTEIQKILPKLQEEANKPHWEEAPKLQKESANNIHADAAKE